MIPKDIHYCWFGRAPLPDLAVRCIESWKKFCPDYRIIEWNEDNFDVYENTYTKEAYINKKYAFVSDYVRLKVLYEHGGIYMDTDVELLNTIDPFLIHEGFSGFENEKEIPTGIMGAIAHQRLIGELLEYYRDKHFVLENGMFDTTTNVIIITNIANKYGFKPNNEYQEILGMAFYPNDFFCPKNHITRVVSITENTTCIHHFNGSWFSEKERKYIEVYGYIYKRFGTKALLIYRIYRYIFHPWEIVLKFKEYRREKRYDQHNRPNI